MYWILTFAIWTNQFPLYNVCLIIFFLHHKGFFVISLEMLSLRKSVDQINLGSLFSLAYDDEMITIFMVIAKAFQSSFGISLSNISFFKG